MMKANDLLKPLKLENKVLSILLTNDEAVPEARGSGMCTMALLNRAIRGETLRFGEGRLSCLGAARGMGFFDGVPSVKGGFGNFISYGAGEGFPKGERIKNCPETAEKMMQTQPNEVLDGHKYIVVKPYEESDAPALITFLANPDQLSGLIQLFSYRTDAYDNVIAPLSSGCASIFRIPLGELKRENPRAVIGNVDMVSRLYFDENTFFFTVPGKAFVEMCHDAADSFLITSAWKSISDRF